MKWFLIPFVLGRVAKSLKELFWTHVLTSGIMAMTLFLFGGFILLQENLQGALRGWGNQIQIFAYLKDGTTAPDVESLVSRVRAFPEVENVRYVSREDAWRDFQKALGSQAGVLEGLEADILPSSLEITLEKPYRERPRIEDLARRLRAIQAVSEVEYPEEWLEKLNLLLWGVQWAKWLVGAFLFVATLFIVGSTVRLAILARRDEIEIMQLVGATQRLIKAPFVIEGMVQGLVGASFSLLLLWLLYMFLSVQLPPTLKIFVASHRPQFLGLQGVMLILFLGWALGAGGSLFSLKRFFKIWAT